MNILGIDPGLDGALCILPIDDTAPLFYDTPVLEVRGKGGTRREYNLPAMASLLRPWIGARVAIEQVHAMPGQGVRSMWTMGFGVGAWEGVLAGLSMSYQRVTPQRWKKVLMDGMGHEKDASRLRALQLFPACAAMLHRKKDHGRADALLIAEWLRRTAWKAELVPAALGPPEAR